MRRPFTAQEAYERGITQTALKWGVRTGRYQRITRGVYIDGIEDLTLLEQALVQVAATGGVASGTLAAVLYGLDGVVLKAPFVTVSSGSISRRYKVRRRNLEYSAITKVDAVTATDGLQTMIDLAPCLTDLVWEQTLESALRKRLTTLDQLSAALPRLSHERASATTRIRRVLALRPSGAPPTESLLETLAVQLIRRNAQLPEPARQFEIRDGHGMFVARVDLSWPDRGIFLELDGEHHKNQPRYDASRQTWAIATTGWLCGRYTWNDIVHNPMHTLRSITALHSHRATFTSTS